MSDPAEICQRWLVSGRVQGVGFRWFVYRAASELGLAGRVRNLPDGSVEVIARGREVDLDRLASLVSKGPSWSRVTGVAREEGWLQPEQTDFRIET